MKKIRAEDACNEVINQVVTLRAHLVGSSPVGNVEDLEDACVDSFFLVVDAVDELRRKMRKEGYDVPKERVK